jgi:hypothetical protein
MRKQRSGYIINIGSVAWVCWSARMGRLFGNESSFSRFFEFLHWTKELELK